MGSFALTTKDPIVAYWDPPRRRFRDPIGRRLPLFAPANNFGDLLGPLVVREIMRREGRPDPACLPLDKAGEARKLLSVGSVLQFARDGDLVWGAGRNGKIPDDRHGFARLDVRMVRGPKTRAFLESRGIACPAVFGDPGLLVPALFADRIAQWGGRRAGVALVANLNDPRPRLRGARTVDPRAPLWSVLRAIHESEVVVSSSLHGFILAEVFGVRARLLASRAEPPFKYEDYFLGTGRDRAYMHATVADALAAPDHPAPVFDAGRMMAAFPFDAFSTEAAIAR